ncbi:MAG: hypothetical protein ISS80_04645 [Candidatus Cloacimonetes bacterium]|nr:hypothetical protein [Candidatus Cloacimonadota bacterium]
MRKLISIIMLLMLVNSIFPQNISEEQNIKNKQYLVNLELNVLETIEIMVMLNEASKQLPEDTINGISTYQKFLFDMTMECSNIRNDIKLSKNMSPNEREEHITMMFATIRPEVIYTHKKIDNSQDLKNRETINELHERIKKYILFLQYEIVKADKRVIEHRSISQYYMNLHSQHFMLQLLSDYIANSDKLSNNNREYLLKIALSIESVLVPDKR